MQFWYNGSRAFPPFISFLGVNDVGDKLTSEHIVLKVGELQQ